MSSQNTINHFDNNVFVSASLQVDYWDKEGQCLPDIKFPPTGKAKHYP